MWKSTVPCEGLYRRRRDFESHSQKLGLRVLGSNAIGSRDLGTVGPRERLSRVLLVPWEEQGAALLHSYLVAVGGTELAWEKGKGTEQKLEISKKFKAHTHKKTTFKAPGVFSTERAALVWKAPCRSQNT